MYSTGNYTHYLVITYNGEQSAKTLNHYAVHLTPIQYCKSTILQKEKVPWFIRNAERVRSWRERWGGTGYIGYSKSKEFEFFSKSK